jgi:hypothetical protein
MTVGMIGRQPITDSCKPSVKTDNSKCCLYSVFTVTSDRTSVIWMLSDSLGIYSRSTHGMTWLLRDVAAIWWTDGQPTGQSVASSHSVQSLSIATVSTNINDDDVGSWNRTNRLQTNACLFCLHFLCCCAVDGWRAARTVESFRRPSSKGVGSMDSGLGTLWPETSASRLTV